LIHWPGVMVIVLLTFPKDFMEKPPSWYLYSLLSSLWRIFEEPRGNSCILAKGYKSRGGSERSWCGMSSVTSPVQVQFSVWMSAGISKIWWWPPSTHRKCHYTSMEEH
jgi:hypothetical protein